MTMSCTIVYEDFMDKMPYGTAKARTGDPDNWLADHFDQVMNYYFNTLLKEAEVRNEIPQFMKLVDYHLGDGA